MLHHNNDIDLFTNAMPYVAIPERLNLRESEDDPTLFFRLMLPLVVGCIYFPVLISFYLIAMLNHQKTPYNTVTFSSSLV